MQGLPADGKGLADIVAASARAGQWEPALAAWSLLHSCGRQTDAACLNALLEVLRGAGQWQHAIRVFQVAKQSQVPVWAVLEFDAVKHIICKQQCLNALVEVLRGAGQWQHAIRVFQVARQSQVPL